MYDFKYCWPESSFEACLVHWCSCNCKKAHTKFARKLRLSRENIVRLNLYFTALLQALILAESVISLLEKEVWARWNCNLVEENKFRHMKWQTWWCSSYILLTWRSKDAWYKNMEPCTNSYPDVSYPEWSFWWRNETISRETLCGPSFCLFIIYV